MSNAFLNNVKIYLEFSVEFWEHFKTVNDKLRSPPLATASEIMTHNNFAKENAYSDGKLWNINSAILYNVIPPYLQDFDEYATERHILFQGNVLIQELLSHTNGSNASMPKYQLRFAWKGHKDKLFSITDIITDYNKMQDTIIHKSKCFDIKMKCLDLYVLLELRFQSEVQERNFKDVLFRINEEYEILSDMPW